MTLTHWRDTRRRLVREWSCCGLVWQLILSARYPERRTWTPTCPHCRSKED
jgi:hypothetical protein